MSAVRHGAVHYIKTQLMHRSKVQAYSITSSARASRTGGTVRPSAVRLRRRRRKSHDLLRPSRPVKHVILSLIVADRHRARRLETDRNNVVDIDTILLDACVQRFDGSSTTISLILERWFGVVCRLTSAIAISFNLIWLSHLGETLSRMEMCRDTHWDCHRRCTSATCSSCLARSASVRSDRRSAPGYASSMTRSPSRVAAALSGR